MADCLFRSWYIVVNTAKFYPFGLQSSDSVYNWSQYNNICPVALTPMIPCLPALTLCSKSQGKEGHA